MGRRIKIPVTPEVVRWAINESGYSVEDVALASDVRVEAVKAWMKGRDRPTLTQAKALASKVRRPLAALLLPAVPAFQTPTVEFRRPPGSARRELIAEERNALRDAVRLQRIVAWTRTQAGAEPIRLPRYSLETRPELAATAIRKLLAIPDDVRHNWQSDSDALAGWRAAIERLGVLVFVLPMGSEACRGFSVWEDTAPLIATNTWWNTAARTYTILHELGHLVTRTSSACLAPATNLRAADTDATERWCEEFAAAVMLPMDEVERFLRDETGLGRGQRLADIRPIQQIAKRFKVSLRAAALRLIKSDLADRRLYGAIPEASDEKRRGGGGGGRPRYEVRRDQFGTSVVRSVLDGVRSGDLTTTDALGYLDITYSDLAQLAREVGVVSTEA